jgi:squalene cyclase
MDSQRVRPHIVRPAAWLLLASLAYRSVVPLPAAAEEVVSPAAVQEAVERSLPLLVKAAVGHRENRTCFACHNQGVPLLALAAAQARGWPVDAAEIDRQLAHIVRFLDQNREKYLEGKGQGGQVDTAGYALWTLAAWHTPPNPTTTAVVEYLLQRHHEHDHWLNSSQRPPSEASPFTTTFLALYGLNHYGPADRQARIEARQKQVQAWLVRTPPRDQEDRVFRLLALAEVHAPPEALTQAAQALREAQRDDGGWAQCDSGELAEATRSDAYATGSALVALALAGQATWQDRLYQRGVAYLVRTQQPDGSWHVVSRSKPFQTYFESGYPHGKDQFISCAAGAWATWALVLSLPPRPGPPQPPGKDKPPSPGPAY